MAEYIISGVAESLTGKLASRAFEEASRLVGVYDDLREIQDTLLLVKAVLLDAEQKQEHNHELRVWLRQLKLVFSDAENVLDEVECEALLKHVVNTHGSTKRKLLTLPQWLQGSANALQSLIFIDCENLEVLPEWLSTLSCLKVLWLHDCPKLLSLPHDINRLISLEHLQIKYCPELSEKYQPQIGEYWPKISHVKHVDIDEVEQFDKEKKDSRERKMRRHWKR